MRTRTVPRYNPPPPMPVQADGFKTLAAYDDALMAWRRQRGVWARNRRMSRKKRMGRGRMIVHRPLGYLAAWTVRSARDIVDAIERWDVDPAYVKKGTTLQFRMPPLIEVLW